jgi:hypothetical protein
MSWRARVVAMRDFDPSLKAATVDSHLVAEVVGASCMSEVMGDDCGSLASRYTESQN